MKDTKQVDFPGGGGWKVLLGAGWGGQWRADETSNSVKVVNFSNKHDTVIFPKGITINVIII